MGRFLIVHGTTLGNYVIEERIGRGGMGVVYRARHTKLPREAAIKLIDGPDIADVRQLRGRLEREAYILQSQLDHPGIVNIYDYIVSDKRYCIVMEYVPGKSLARLLREKNELVPATHALDLFEEVLSAVAFAHNFTYVDPKGKMRRGIIHRDLKPGNILVTTDDHTKITDFGIVQLVGSDAFESSDMRYGSPWIA